ncbi:MAG TPA: hypothetical protein VI461_17540 [Chitinophagaceae bacterium]|nr:hypothetical protein [Chitinophagaceae bacterium]
MKKKYPDRHLDAPSEANRDKHINYTALESGDIDPADEKRKGKLAASENKDKKDKKKDRDHPRTF